MSLCVVNVAYPFARVAPDSVGGAEQIVGQLDQALVEHGHRSIVVACRGSSVSGELVELPEHPGVISESTRRAVWHACRRAIDHVIARERVDLVHMHGVDFCSYLPPRGVPVLATLHLPPNWYPSGAFRLDRPEVRLQSVSWSQHRACPPCSLLLDPIENGVPAWLRPRGRSRRRFALALGRICPEKGFHLALDAARRAGVPLMLAGEVFPYPEHQAYFLEQIVPRLDRWRHFIGPVGPARKVRLLSAARCLLAPSLVAETSSLVAMEALACGTPVVAFPRGALADIVEHGETGLLVEGVQQMAAAIHQVGRLNRAACLRAAGTRFSAERMINRYLQVYAELGAAPRGLTQWPDVVVEGMGCDAVVGN